MTCSKSSALRQRGFTLIEIAIVLMIIGFMLGTILGPLSKQRQNQKIQSTESLLKEVQDALLGFVALHGYLPCPSTRASRGVESRVAGAGSDCMVEHGFVPSNTLGLTGHFDRDNLLTDDWSGAVHYSLNNANTWEFAKKVTLQSGPASFSICSTGSCAAGTVMAANIVAVIFSIGPDQDTAPPSADQIENLDGDDQFVSRIPTEGIGTEFDDVITWLSPNILALQLVKSGQLNN